MSKLVLSLILHLLLSLLKFVGSIKFAKFDVILQRVYEKHEIPIDIGHLKQRYIEKSPLLTFT